MADISSSEEEKQVKKIKRKLEGWREIILPLNSILLWEKQWFAGLIIGLSTISFLMVWIIDPSILTFLSTSGLIIMLVDYLVPTIIQNVCKPDSWTGAKEKAFEEICHSIFWYYNECYTMYYNLKTIKSMRPKVYYMGITISLLVLAWLGNAMNNLFITYVVVTFMLIWPGLNHNGVIAKQTTFLKTKINEIISKTKTKVEGKLQ